MANVIAPRPEQFLKLFREGSKALRKAKKVDPRERYVMLFPEASKAHVGMAFNLLNRPAAERVFEEANELAKKNILRLCLEGPKSELYDSLESQHLATFVTSHATVTQLSVDDPTQVEFAKAAGGFGIGFVNCLVLSGSMSFKDGLDLVQRMGQAMDRAAKVVPSARVKVRLMPATRKLRVCKTAIEHCIRKGIPPEVAVCSVTKQTYAHSIEIAGHEEAIKYLEDEGRRLFQFRLIERVARTPRAYHTDLMAPASQFIKVYLDQRIKDDPEYLRDPITCSVYSSTAGCRLRTVKAIKKDLVNYPIRPILVEQLIHTLFNRPASLPQPNILVAWDKKLLDALGKNNRKAGDAAKLLV